MYGGGMQGGMQGRQQGDGEFFAPLVQEMPQQPGQEELASKNRLDINDLNTGFLDSLHTYGDHFMNVLRRLAKGFVSLQAALRAGTLPPATAQKAFLAVAVMGAACIALAARAAAKRRRQRSSLAWNS